MLPPRGVTPHPGAVEESKSPGDGDGGPVVPPESTRSFVVRRRRNAAQTRLKLFIAAVVLLCVGGALPFLLKETAFRGVSVVAVSELSACAVSLLCCGVVLRTYADGPGAYRRHPNRLIVLKTACDGGLNVVVLCLFSTSSEAWFFVLLLDLRRSVRNPFYAFESSRRLYGVGAWTLGVASAAVLVAWKRPILYGVLDFAACWIKDHSAWERVRPSARDLPKWCLFYGPLVAVYAYALYVLWVVRSRLSRGLSSTFAARVRVAAVSVLTVLTYVTYWLVHGALTNDALRRELLYYVTSGIRQAARASGHSRAGGGRRPSTPRPSDASLSAPDGDRPINLKRRDVGAPIALSLAKLLQLFFWDDADGAAGAGDAGGRRCRARATPRPGPGRAAADHRRGRVVRGVDGDDDASRAGSVAPRAGSVRSAPRAALPRARRAGRASAAPAAATAAGLRRAVHGRAVARARRRGGLRRRRRRRGHRLRGLQAADLRARDRARACAEEYANSFRSTQKERFTEGGSSDAFFYSGDERFMVKSCTRHEFDSLVDMADGYAAYMCEPANGATFVVRLLGAHCLRLYEMAFYFLVMANVFDVAGSGEQARAPPRPGRRLTCHCNRKYTAPEKGDASDFFAGRRVAVVRAPEPVRGPTRCAARRGPTSTATTAAAPGPAGRGAGRPRPRRDLLPEHRRRAHEPQVTLKDNDLNDANRLTLPRGDALAMARQLRRDAAMLEGLGIMDYSLLLGVRSEYPVDDDAAGDRGDRGDDGSTATARAVLRPRVPPAQYARRFMDKMADLLGDHAA
ncbi:translation initiation factor IF-2 [Aureococcus anophagefferens]|nr:translation initiation factor IF-2 [Aureococcus anophagefferens]